MSATIVAIVALSFVGLIYTQPWSKVAVALDSRLSSSVYVSVYIDGELMSALTVEAWGIADFVYYVEPGFHTVGIEKSHSGVMSYFETVKVGPLGTSEVRATL